MTLADMEPIANTNAIVATMVTLVNLNQDDVFANKVLLDLNATVHVQKDFTALVANKPVFLVHLAMGLAII